MVPLLAFLSFERGFMFDKFSARSAFLPLFFLADLIFPVVHKVMEAKRVPSLRIMYPLLDDQI